MRLNFVIYNYASIAYNYYIVELQARLANAQLNPP